MAGGRGDKIRRWVFWSYMVLSFGLLLSVIYGIIDRMTILMYYPVGMEDESVAPELIKELCGHVGDQIDCLFCFGIFVCANIIIAVALFVATRKTFKQPKLK